MESTEPEAEGEESGLDLIGQARETAMNSCNSITKSLGIAHMLKMCVSPLIHAADVGSDANLAYRYYADGEYMHAGFTAFFIIGPTILISMVQKMYFQDFSPGSILKWIYQMVLMVLPVSPFLSSFQAFNQMKNLKKSVTDFTANPNLDKLDAFQLRVDSMQKEKSTAAMLGVAEGFLKSAPQLVLQITIFLSRGQLLGSIHLYLALASSFASTLKAFVGFYNSLKSNKTTWVGTALLYVWSSLVITSRIMAISLGQVVHPIETMAICFIHWFGMTVWLSFLENTRYVSPPKPGRLGKLFAQIPLNQLKVETLTKVGAKVKDEALAKVGALTSVFTRNEVDPSANAAAETEVNCEVKAEAEKGADAPGDVEAQQKNGTTQADLEAQTGEKGADAKGALAKSGVTLKKIFFNSIFGLIYIFVYVSIVEKPTRNKYAFYYFVWFLENCFFLVIGLPELWNTSAWLMLSLRAATFGGVLFSLVIMFIYITCYNLSLWPDKVNVSEGLGLKSAYEYGLNGLKAIDPTQLIPLKTINPAEFIPKLDSLPGVDAITGLIPENLSDALPGTGAITGLISGNLSDALPGADAITGLIPGNLSDALPSTDAITGLIPEKLSDALPSTQLISGLIPGTEAKLPDSIPGAQLISGLIPGTENKLPDAVPGAQLISGLFSSSKEESPAGNIPGAKLLTNLISSKEEGSPTTVPGAQLVTGLFSGQEEKSPAALISGLMSKKDYDSPNGLESLSKALPGADLASGLISGMGESSSIAIPEVQSITGLISGTEDSVASAIPGAALASGLISGKEESSETAPASEFISGLVAGKDESALSALPGAGLVSGLVSTKEENSSDASPATQLVSGLLPGKEKKLPKLW